MNQTTPPDEAAEILKEFATYCAVQGTPFGSMPNDWEKLDEALAKINQLRVRDRLEEIDGLINKVVVQHDGVLARSMSVSKLVKRKAWLEAQLTIREHSDGL